MGVSSLLRLCGPRNGAEIIRPGGKCLHLWNLTSPHPLFGTGPEVLLRVLASSRNLYAPDMESRKEEWTRNVRKRRRSRLSQSWGIRILPALTLQSKVKEAVSTLGIQSGKEEMPRGRSL